MAKRGVFHRILARWGPATSDRQQGRDAESAQADLLSSARSHVQAGRPHQAEQECRDALALAPGNVDALLLLGGLRYQSEAFEEAAVLFEKASTASEGDPRPWGNWALALHAAHRSSAAINVLRTALVRFPRSDNIHNLLGFMLCAQGDATDAESSFRSALTLNPDHFEARMNLGTLCVDGKRWHEAEEHLRRAVEVRPEVAECWRTLARCCRETRRFPHARECVLQGLIRSPGDAPLHHEAGLIALAREDWREAKTCFDRALALDGSFLDACCNSVEASLRMGKLDEAWTTALRANAIRPRSAEAMNALALVAIARRDWLEADRICREALVLHVGHRAFPLLLGTMHVAMGELDAAREDYSRALLADPDSASASYALGIVEMQAGNWRKGFHLYERRFDAFPGLYADVAVLLDDPRRWHGESIVDRRILVWTEQGHGDFLMMLRYLPLLRQRGAAEIVVACNVAMQRLVIASDVADIVLAGGDPPTRDRYDVHVSVLSLPLAFSSTPESVPASVPYIIVPAEIRKAVDLSAESAGVLVGLCWAGSAALRDDAKRNVSLDALATLSEVADCSWISLQKGPRAADAENCKWLHREAIDRCSDFLDTAALVSRLDLVITVDTAVAHLAGSLGKPVWLLNRRESEWRWGNGKTETTWYPTMRIFAEDALGGWPVTLHRVREALAGWPDSGTTAQLRVHH